jgi:tryptophan synthase alpha subunit
MQNPNFTRKDLPVAAGFGISIPAPWSFGTDAYGCFVGSAVVNQIAEMGKSPELVAKVGAFLKLLADTVKAV